MRLRGNAATPAPTGPAFIRWGVVAARSGRTAGSAFAWTLGMCLALASCGPSEPKYSVARADSLTAALVSFVPDSNSIGNSDADTLCLEPPAAVAQPPAGRASRVRAGVRRELERMGFSTCVRVVWHTVQRDTWLRHYRATELVALRRGVDEDSGIIHVPVHYRAPLRRDAEPISATAVRPAATVLAAMCAFLADSACAQGLDPQRYAPRTGLALSFTNLEEWRGGPHSALAAAGGPDAQGSVFVTSAADPLPPSVVGSDPGWVVGQLDVGGGPLGVPAGVVFLPGAIPDHAGSSRAMGSVSGPWCPPERLCEAIVPGSPEMHVRGVFGWDEAGGEAAVRESHRLGVETLKLLRAADILAFGIPLQQNPTLRWWWLLPVALLALAFYFTAFAILGPFDKAIQIAIGLRWSAWLRKRWTRFRHLLWGIPLAIRKRSAARAERRRDRGEGDRAQLELEGLVNEATRAVEVCRDRSADRPVGVPDAWVDECGKELGAVQQWLEKTAELHKSKNDLGHRVDVGKQSLATCADCIFRDRSDPSDEAGAWGWLDRIRACRAVVSWRRVPLDDADHVKEVAWDLWVEGRRLAKRTEGLAARAHRPARRERRSAGKSASAAANGGPERIRAAEALDRMAQALAAEAAAVRLDSVLLRKRARVLFAEGERRLLEMDRRWHETMGSGTRFLEKDFRSQRRDRENYIGRGMGDLGQMLAEIGTLSLLRWPRWLVVLTVAVILATPWLLTLSPLPAAWRLPAAVALLGVATVILFIRRIRSGERDTKRLGGLWVFLCGIALVAVLSHKFAPRIGDPVPNDWLVHGVHEGMWMLVYIGVGVLVLLAFALGAEQHKPERLDHLDRWASERKDTGRSPNTVPPQRVFPRVRRDVFGAVGAHALLLAVVVVVAIVRAPEPSWLPHRTLGVPIGPDATNHSLTLLLWGGAFLLPALAVLRNLPPASAPATAAAGSPPGTDEVPKTNPDDRRDLQ